MGAILGIMGSILARIASTIAARVFTEKVVTMIVISLLEYIAKKTTNKLDDMIIKIIKGAMSNDLDDDLVEQIKGLMKDV